MALRFFPECSFPKHVGIASDEEMSVLSENPSDSPPNQEKNDRKQGLYIQEENKNRSRNFLTSMKRVK